MGVGGVRYDRLRGDLPTLRCLESASGRHGRNCPLWGSRRSAPRLHRPCQPRRRILLLTIGIQRQPPPPPLLPLLPLSLLLFMPRWRRWHLISQGLLRGGHSAGRVGGGDDAVDSRHDDHPGPPPWTVSKPTGVHAHLLQTLKWAFGQSGPFGFSGRGLGIHSPPTPPIRSGRCTWRPWLPGKPGAEIA